ncbi:MAG: sugar-binding protein, partial [Candidatus Sumerlaeota bacterium]
AYARETVSRYHDRIHTWEIWNEPNITPFWMPAPDPSLYASLLAQTYDEIKKADPNAQVVGMCVSGPDYKFIDGAYRAGARGKFDALSFHHYNSSPDESMLEAEIRTIKRIMERYGDTEKPFYISELGYTTGPSTVAKPVDFDEQAEWIVKSHLISIAEYVQRYYYYKMIDDDPKFNPDGLWGLYEHDLKKKKSWQAYKTMTERLSAATFVGRASRAVVEFARRDEAEFQLYETAGELLGVAWVRKEGAPLRLLVNSDQPVLVENLYGEKIDSYAPNENKEVLIPITHEPVYLRGLGAGIRNMASINFAPANLSIAPGETRTVRMTVDNKSGVPMDVMMTAFEMPRKDFPIKFQWDKAALIADPGKSVTRDITVTRSDSAEEFPPASITYNDNQHYSYRLGISGSPAFAATIRGEVQDTQLTLYAAYQNQTNQPQSGSVVWNLGGASTGDPKLFSNLGEGDEGIAELPFPISHGEQLISFIIKDNEGVSTTTEFHLAGLSMVDAPPVIDGGLDDWSSANFILLSPEIHQLQPARIKEKIDPTDFSGRVAVRWSETALYIAAAVTDKTPLRNAQRGTELWKGDSIELYLGFDGPTERGQYDAGQFQIGINPGNDGKQPFVWNWKPIANADGTKPADGIKIADAKVASVKTPDGYAVEAMIPLSAFKQTVLIGQYLGFDVHLNDSDDAKADAPHVVLGWNGTKDDFKDPSRWGIAQILAPQEQNNQ